MKHVTPGSEPTTQPKAQEWQRRTAAAASRRGRGAITVVTVLAPDPTSPRLPFIALRDEKDMHELNRLQFASADENIYFRDPMFDPRPGFKRAAGFRRVERTSQKVFPGSRPNSEIYATFRHEIRTGLKLTFVQATRAAKKWREEFRRQPNQPAIVVRDPQLCDDHGEFMRRLRSGDYKAHDFGRFMKERYRTD